MTRLEQAVKDTAAGVDIVSRDQLLGLLEAVQCGKVNRDDAAKRLERWVDVRMMDAAKFTRDKFEPGLS